MLNYRRGVSRQLPELTVGTECVIATYTCQENMKAYKTLTVVISALPQALLQ